MGPVAHDSGPSMVSLDEDGLALGDKIPDNVAARLEASGASSSDSIVVFFSIGCSPCVERASEISAIDLSARSIVFLIAGSDRRRGAVDLESALGGVDCVKVWDPAAREIAHDLGIHSTPFAIVTTDGAVSAKRYLRSGSDISALLLVAGTGSDGNMPAHDDGVPLDRQGGSR